MADEQENDTSQGGIENVMHQVESGEDPSKEPQDYPEQQFHRERIVSPDPDNPPAEGGSVWETEGSSDERPQLPPGKSE
jgi:hypothetical protein